MHSMNKKVMPLRIKSHAAENNSSYLLGLELNLLFSKHGV